MTKMVPPDEPCEHLGQLVHLTLQRREVVVDGVEHVGDVAHLGRHAGLGHDDRARSPG